MGWLTRAIVIVVISASAGTAMAQSFWVQVEAQPSLRDGEARARAWAETLPDVAGFAMSTGWYAVAIGPFSETDAAQKLQLLRGERLIPSDSYLSDGRNFRQQFWPVGAALQQQTPTAVLPEIAADPATPAAPMPAPGAVASADTAPVADPAPPVEPVETLAQARAAEAALPRADRELIQTALQWQGFYSAAIDGAFGPGTRKSIAAWQQANGVDVTGILASRQRADLIAAYQGERAALGLTLVEDAQAAIAVEMPMGLVTFDHYDPPFVHYTEKDGSGVRVLLISQQGDQNSLFGLYDVMQTLEIVPFDGPRERSRSGFTLTGQNDTIHSHTEVSLRGGLIKGFTLVYPAADAVRMERVLKAMQGSFKGTGDTALDETLGQPLAEPRADLLAGLDVRQPALARSGFYIDSKGTVLTAGADLQSCARITVDGTDFEMAFDDTALGFAVLTPRDALAPMSVAEFQTTATRLNSSIAVAGYPYADALSAPVLTFGKLADLSGLAGEPGLARLALGSLDGDVGGPVFDTSGAVIGMLLPRATGGAQILPADLTLAVQSTAMAPALAEKGFAPTASQRSGTLATEDLSLLALGMTVQVSCWN